MEKQLQTHLKFEETLTSVELGMDTNCYKEKTSEVLPKQHNQIVKQLHQVEKYKNSTPWINIVYLLGKGYNDLGSKVVSFCCSCF